MMACCCYGVQHICSNPTLSSHHHSERFTSFFLLLWHAWPHGQGQEIVDVKVHCLIILCTIPLLHIYICIHVLEDLGEHVIHQEIVDLEWIVLAVQIGSIQNILSQLDFNFFVNDGVSGNHLLINVQVSILSRRDICHNDVVLEHISQWNPP